MNLPHPRIEGIVAPGFERVRRVFEEGFTQRGERGAAFAVEIAGELVVDLWGGTRDATTGAPWESDTGVLTYSVTKGMSATAVAVLLSHGHLDEAARVADYWPEFSQAGKQDIRVWQLLAHRAGLPALDAPLTPALLAAPDRLDPLLARQAPAWAPGTQHGYHPITLGLYLNALARRVDPRGRSLGRIFADEVAAPLGIAYTIGQPAPPNAAKIAPLQPVEALLQLRHLSWPFLRAYLRDPLTRRTFGNPAIAHPSALDTPAWHAVESPSSNGIGTARAVAKVYGALAAGGSRLGLSPATMAKLTAYPDDPPRGRVERILGVESVYSFGFSRPTPSFRFGASPAAFGAPGAGGSFGFADPARRLGYAYLTNRLGYHLSDDPREHALRRALDDCLSSLGTP